VTGPGVSDDDMPSFRRSARRDESPLTDESLAALLSGALPPEDVPPDLRAAADVLAALRVGPGRDELADEAAALAEFRIRGPRHHGTRLTSARGSRRRGSVRLPSLSGKIAAITAVIAVAVGGVATAAIIGVLPAPLQHAFHDVIPVVRIRGGGKGHPASSGRAGHGRGSVAHCAGPGHTQPDGSLARPGQPATGRCARHRPITREPVKSPRHGRCTPFPWASWSVSPRPSWTPSAWPAPSAGPTRWPAWDMPRCGQHWRWHWHWLRWHRHHLHWPGWPHSPAPSPTGPTKHHRAPQPGHNPTPQPSPQPTARHTGQPAPGHSSQPTRHHSQVRT
jgi:hypothetical protein